MSKSNHGFVKRTLSIILIFLMLLSVAPVKAIAGQAEGVTITPNGGGSGTVQIVPGNIIQFSAVVAGSNNPPQDVIWSCSYSGSAYLTMIDSGTGVLQVDGSHPTAADSNTFTVTATSKFNSEVMDTVTVQVVSSGAPAMNNVSGVTIPSQNLSVAKGYPIVLTATVSGEGNPSQTITWSVTGNTSVDTKIESSSGIGGSEVPGRLLVAEDETSAILTVKAACGAYYDEATITVTAPPDALVFTDSSSFDIPESKVGQAITSIDLSGAVSGGTPPYKFSGKYLPAGVSISADGVVSGAPTATDNNGGSATITVTDSDWPMSKRQTADIDINYGVISEADAPIEDTLVAKPVLAWMGSGSASEADLYASTYKLSWTFNNHYISSTSAYRYRVRIFEHGADISTAQAVKDSDIMNPYDVDVIASSLTISCTMDLSGLTPSTRDKTTGEFIPNYKLVVDAYHPENLNAVVATDTVDVIHGSLGLRVYDRTNGKATAIFVDAAGNISPIEVDVFGIMKSDIEDGIEAELKFEVKKNDGTFEDFSGTTGVFTQLSDDAVKAAAYPSGMMTGYKCNAIINATVPDVNTYDTYTCRFTFESLGESTVFEKTIYTINPAQSMTLTLSDGLEVRENAGPLYDLDYSVNTPIVVDNHSYIGTGTAQEISNRVIGNLSSITLDRIFELSGYPNVIGTYTNLSQKAATVSEADKAAGIDYASTLCWNFTNIPDFSVEVMVKAKLLAHELYIFSVPDNTKIYELTYNDKTVSLSPGNFMVAVYEPDGITTDVLITADNGTKRATVPNNKLLSGEDTYPEILTFNSDKGLRTPRINKTSFADYTFVKAYLKGQGGESLAGKTVTVNMALLDGDGDVLVSDKNQNQIIGANGLISVPSLVHSGGAQYIIELIIDGYDPVLKYIPAAYAGEGVPFSKLPVFILYKTDTSPGMLTGIYEEKQRQIASGGYLLGYNNLSRIDMTALSSGDGIQYDHRAFDYRNHVELTLVADAKKVGTNPAAPLFAINGQNIPLTDSGNKRIKVTDLGDQYDFLQNDYYQYSLQFFEGFQPVSTTVTPVLTHGNLSLQLPIFSYCALTPEQAMERELRNLRLAGEQAAKLDALKNQGLDGNMDKLFENFSIALPSGLPFTFNLEKKGNEYIVRGILSANLLPIPGGTTWAQDFGADAAESFESVFNDVMAEVISAKTDNEAARTMLRLQFSQASAFGGVRGYLSGKAVFDPKTNSFVVSFNDGGVIAEISGSVTVEGMMPMLPFCVFGLSAEGLAKLDMRIKAPTAAELLQADAGAVVRVNLEQETTVEANITLNAGVGVPDVIPTSVSGSAGGYAKAGAGSQMLTVIRPYQGGDTDMYVRYFVEGELGLYWKVSLGPLKIGQFFPLLKADINAYSPDSANNPYRPSGRAMTVSAMQTTRSNALSQPQIAVGFGNASMPRYANSFLYHDEGTAVFGDERLMYRPDVGDAAPIEDIATYDFHSQTSGGVTSVLAQTLDLTPDEFEALEKLGDPTAQIDALSNRLGMKAYLLDGTGEILKERALSYLPNSMNLNPRTAISGDNSIYVWKSGSMLLPEDMTEGMLPYSTDLLGALVFARGDTAGSFTAVTPITALNRSFQIESYSVSMLEGATALVAANDVDGNVYLYIITPENNVLTVQSAQKGFDAQTAVVNGKFAITCVGDDGYGGQSLYVQLVDKNGTAVQHDAIEVPGVGNNYKLVVDGATLGVFWTELRIGTEKSESRLQGALIDTANAIVGAPQTIVTASEGKTITGFDCRLTGKAVEAIVNYSWFDTDDAIETGIDSHSYTFENNVNTGVRFDYADFVPEREMEFFVALENAGTAPITEVKITIDKQETIHNINANPLNPGEVRELAAAYTVPETPGGSLDYFVEATFSGGDTGTGSGTINTAKTDAVIETLSVEEAKDAQTFIFGVFNDSGIALSTGQKVKVGLYTDALGENLLAPGFETIVDTAADLALIEAGGYSARFEHDGALAANTYLYALVSVLDSQNKPVYDTVPDNNMAILRTTYTQDDPSPAQPGSGGTSQASATLSISTVTFDSATPKDISVTLATGGYSLVKITCDGTTLTEGKEYTKNGNTYTFAAAYLGTLAVGEHEIIFDMSGGNDPVITVTVTVDGAQAEWKNPFSDVHAADWFYGAVQYAYQNGIMRGTDATTFAPQTALNRAMMVQILYNLEGTTASGSATFDDVESGVWYENAIAWATDNGIVNGYGDGNFGPTDEITREQMAVMLYSYCRYKGIELPVIRAAGTFTDVDIVSDWALDAVQALYEAGILNGKGGGVFDPKGTATRAEVAQTMMNFIQTSKI